MSIRTVTDDRLRVLVGQLDGAWEILDNRLAGLTDQEYFWEPAPGCWSLRPRGEAVSSMPVGKGEWMLDREIRPPQPAPFTTIAWRLCHVAVSPLMRYEYTFGDHALTIEDIEWPGSAREGVRFLGAIHERWRNALNDLQPEELDQIGRSQFPFGWDPDVRFVDLLAWTNTEFTHHAAEIACLRDLYRIQPQVR